MRFNCSWILFVVCLFSGVTAQCQNSKGRKLVWSDEFNYLGMPDSTKWSYETGGNGWGNNELQNYTSADTTNAKVKNGMLHISAVKQQKENRSYTSARLVSENKGAWKYGKIEIKARLPRGRGLWPAIWMLGENHRKTGWPECGEIDIMEHVGYEPDTILGTIHTGKYNHIIGTQKGKKIRIDRPYEDFHVYAIDWTAEKLDFLLDDKVFYTVVNEHKTVGEWPFDQRFFLILNIAVGGNLGGKKGVDESIFPGTMVVDYVRVYQ
ncbi:MAG: glycoside hydrolase family 16 protein [Bacteroidota bacterium]